MNTKGCDEVRLLLESDWRGSELDTQLLATHIQACPTCHLGIARLSRVLIEGDTLSCEQCRGRFPGYYESTHPEYPFELLSRGEMTEVAVHLGHCVACREQYLALQQLSLQEEEMGDGE